MEHHGDRDLAQAAVSGDFAAFSKIYDTYWPGVAAWAGRRAEHPEAAERLVGEVFRAVFGHLDAYSGRTPLAAWILALARRVDGPAGGPPRA
jgi:DNA-directed RNA polymerase specialized sigma24 family protein